MRPKFGLLPAIGGALAVIFLAASPVGAASQPTRHVHALRMAATAGVSAAGKVGVAPGPCNDPAFKKLGAKWAKGNYRWSFNAASTPKYLTKSAVREVVKKSFSNIVNARNDCKLPDRVDATHTFLGKTSTTAKCAKRDGKNVVGFHKLPFGVLAVTCYWTKNGKMVEADVRINKRAEWTLSLKHCFVEVMLEATMTHEAGHVFGLDHVGEKKHGRLTMSPYLDGPCQNSEATLGKGDLRGLEALY